MVTQVQRTPFAEDVPQALVESVAEAVINTLALAAIGATGGAAAGAVASPALLNLASLVLAGRSAPLPLAAAAGRRGALTGGTAGTVAGVVKALTGKDIARAEAGKKSPMAKATKLGLVRRDPQGRIQALSEGDRRKIRASRGLSRRSKDVLAPTRRKKGGR